MAGWMLHYTLDLLRQKTNSHSTFRLTGLDETMKKFRTNSNVVQYLIKSQGVRKSEEDSPSPSVTGLCWRLQISQDRSGKNKEKNKNTIVFRRNINKTSLPKWRRDLLKHWTLKKILHYKQTIKRQIKVNRWFSSQTQKHKYKYVN